MSRHSRAAPLRTAVASNLAARVGALAVLFVTSLVVARLAGPAGVGVLVLLRLLPWLTGLLAGLGMYGAAPYFLSGPGRDDPRFRSTLAAMALGCGLVGSALWWLATPVLRDVFFPHLSAGLVAVAGIAVLTQLLETASKVCSQGTGDLPGSNRVIVAEEVVFLPLFGALLWLGAPTATAMVLALPLGDLLVAAAGWTRLLRRGFLTPRVAPSWWHARRVAGYGVRAQVGSVALLLNARLDFALVGALLGPAPLGVYAIASRYAELLRLPSLALNYVLYPDYARKGAAAAAAEVPAALRRAGLLPVAAAVPMALAAPVALPLLYGDRFEDAVVPALVLLAGLAVGGATGVVTAFLSASGRPGLGSSAIGAGLVVTVVLDLLLIPAFGVVGAAVASALAYVVTAAVALLCYRAVTRDVTPAARRAPTVPDPVAEVSS